MIREEFFFFTWADKLAADFFYNVVNDFYDWLLIIMLSVYSKPVWQGIGGCSSKVVLQSQDQIFQKTKL